MIESHSWPLWRKVTFRFFFIYFTLCIAPWSWLDSVPGISLVTRYLSQASDWLVYAANEHLFQYKDELVYFNGSGDTSFGWMQLVTFLLLATLGCIGWSLIDRKRENYSRLDFWFRNMVRYYVILVALSYGIIKLFTQQMIFPNLSQLATPLGDFLPMRFSWLFIGYSTPYQIFSGAMEVLTAILLFNRRTVSAGLLVGVGVFAHVFILNICYDIPVKIFSFHLFVYCVFLLCYDAPRLLNFLVFNRSTESNTLYEIHFSQKWQRVTHLIGKAAFGIIFAILPLIQAWGYYQESISAPEPSPFYGVYDVVKYTVGQDTIHPLAMDTLHWKDFIFDKNNLGSIDSRDTTFRQRYRRSYFNFQIDSVEQTIDIKKFGTDTVNLMTLHYRFINKKDIFFRTKLRQDSIHLWLRKSPRTFQLAERQFHWLSEANR